MSGKKLTRSELKRQAILDAAMAAFLENGVDGTSMDALSARAGVSKRTVYNHFPSKEALVMHLLTAMWEQAQQQIHVKYDAGKSLYAQLLTMIGAEIEVLCDRNYLDLVRVAIGHFFYKPEALQEEVDRMTRQENPLVRWLSAAMEDGRLKTADPEFAANQLHSLVKGQCFWPQVMGMADILEREQQRHLAEETVNMFLGHYGTE